MLSAGQDAHISDLDSPPVQGTMTHEDISEWLAINPEATEVIEPLTPTSTQSASNALSTPTPTFSNQVASTGTSASFECGPPDGWVIYVVKAEDTLAKIAGAYGVSVADLQRANCLGNSTALFTGMNIFVPNTPTRTPTATTTGTVTLLPTATSTTVAISPTATCTPIVQPSPTPTSTPDKRTVFSNPEGPDNCATILTCANSYSVNVTDLDGVSWVKMEYSVNSASFSGTEYFLLTQSGETWSGTITVDTSLPGTDTVYWRFWAGDGLSNESYYPASGSYFYTDPLDCF
jgi:LysM repeat protein